MMNEYIKKVESGEMTVKEACAVLGISKQTWYNRIKKAENPNPPKKGGRPRTKPLEYPKRKRGRPHKEEPTDPAPAVDWEKVREAEERERAEWLHNLNKANETMKAFLNRTFPGLWCNLQFEHVDAAAFWYSFELVNDSRRQTWSIRHAELNQ